MKVKCKKIISPVTREDLGDSSPWLTREKEYVVLAVEITLTAGISILIQTNHHHDPIFVSLEGFEVLDQNIPSNWISKSGCNASCWMIPESWTYESFFEELENQKEEAIKLFQEESEVIYREEVRG